MEKADLEALAWAIFAAGAAANYAPPEPDEEVEEEELNQEEVIDDMVETSTMYADQMVAEFATRYGKDTRSRRTRRD
jgi:hypothetical protein